MCPLGEPRRGRRLRRFAGFDMYCVKIPRTPPLRESPIRRRRKGIDGHRSQSDRTPCSSNHGVGPPVPDGEARTAKLAPCRVGVEKGAVGPPLEPRRAHPAPGAARVAQFDPGVRGDHADDRGAQRGRSAHVHPRLRHRPCPGTGIRRTGRTVERPLHRVGECGRLSGRLDRCYRRRRRSGNAGVAPLGICRQGHRASHRIDRGDRPSHAAVDARRNLGSERWRNRHGRARLLFRPLFVGAGPGAVLPHPDPHHARRKHDAGSDGQQASRERRGLGPAPAAPAEAAGIVGVAHTAMTQWHRLPSRTSKEEGVRTARTLGCGNQRLGAALLAAHELHTRLQGGMIHMGQDDPSQFQKRGE